MRSSHPVPSDIFPSEEEIEQHAAQLRSRRSDPDQIEVRRLAEDQLLEKAARRALQPWAGWRSS
jgi:hypothetical protein